MTNKLRYYGVNPLIRIFLCYILFSFVACDRSKIAEPDAQRMEQKEDTAVVENVAVPIDTIPLNYDPSLWTNIRVLLPDVDMDIRYATSNNFVGEPIYDCGGCFLRPKVAVALAKVHQDLIDEGYGGIKIFDCYRPRPYQQRLWDKVPDPRFVSDPKKGSMHTRGAAVDLTIVDTDGKILNMGTDFDSFERESYHNYPFKDSTITVNRNLLKRAMYKRGFKHISTEWWHYSYTLKNYPLSDWVWECD